MGKRNMTTNAVDVELKNISASIKEIKTLIQSNREEVKGDFEKMYNRMETRIARVENSFSTFEKDNTDIFAGKWVEKVAIGLIIAVAGAAIGVFITL